MERGNDYDGTLLAVEGIDGSGKSTVIDVIENWVDNHNIEAVFTAEPTDMATGTMVRDALADKSMPALTDFGLFVADRAAHIENRVRPALEDGLLVVTDRYADSTLAYQVNRIAEETDMGRKATRRWVRNAMAPYYIEPDVTFYIDVSVETARQRLDNTDKFENEQQLQAARNEYNALYDEHDDGVHTIDGEQSLDTVRHEIHIALQTEIDVDSGRQRAIGHSKNARNKLEQMRRAKRHGTDISHDSYDYALREIKTALDQLTE